MLSVIFAGCRKIGLYAECLYAECHYAECHGAKYRIAFCSPGLEKNRFICLFRCDVIVEMKLKKLSDNEEFLRLIVRLLLEAL